MFLFPVLYISNTFLSILADSSSADFWIKVFDVSAPISFKLPFNRNGTVPKAPDTRWFCMHMILFSFVMHQHVKNLLFWDVNSLK